MVVSMAARLVAWMVFAMVELLVCLEMVGWKALTMASPMAESLDNQLGKRLELV